MKLYTLVQEGQFKVQATLVVAHDVKNEMELITYLK